MKNLKTNISVIFLLLAFHTIAQEAWEVDPMPIKLNARIVSMGDNMPVPYAHVINNRTHGGTTSNANGLFTMDMLNIDSLVISAVGYFKESFKVPYNYNGDTVFIFRMRPISINIPQVDVTGSKPTVNLDGVPGGKPVDLPPELRGDAFNEKPSILSAFFTPASFIQYYVSKAEKRKRAVREAMALEKNWEMHSENYNKEIVMVLTGLNELEADTFMVWFNILGVLPYTSTEYEVRASIKEYFEIYKFERSFEQK